MASNEIKCVIKIESASVFRDVEECDNGYILPNLNEKYKYAVLTQDDLAIAFQDESFTHGSPIIACNIGGVIMAGDRMVNHFKLIAGVD